MADVNKFTPFLFSNYAEGSALSLDPKDSGNYQNGILIGSKYGVTPAVLSEYYGKTCTAQEMADLQIETATNILKVNYWNKVNADEINSQKIANELVDGAYNEGTYEPVKELQRILNIDVDGICGSGTIAAANAADEESTYLKMMAARIAFYEALCVKYPEKAIYLPTWKRRVADLNNFNNNNFQL